MSDRIDHVDSLTCEHPRPVGDPYCGACELIDEHDFPPDGNSPYGPRSEDGATCLCWFCASVKGTTDLEPDYRAEYLQVIAENLTEEAMRLYRAGGKDVLDLELHIQSFSYPPAFRTVGPITDDDPYGMNAWWDHDELLAKMPYAEYLQTPEWAEQRRRALLRAGGRCQGCDTDENLETHHRTYERRGAEMPGDLTVLCAGCHTAVHLVADGRRGTVRKASRRARV